MKVMFTVICTVYNAEMYIKECIESVINQSYGNFELIIVDDGSTDNSLRLCREFERKDERIRIYRQENNGVSSARNLGIESSNGDYIIFLDSDDFLDLNYLESIYRNIEKDKKLYVTELTKVLEDGSRITNDKKLFIKDFETEELIFSLLFGESKFEEKYYLGKNMRAIGGKVFQRNVIVDNCIRFDEALYIGEDAVFILEYICSISKENIDVINCEGYFYRIVDNSSVRRYKPDLLEQLILQRKIMHPILSRYNIPIAAYTIADLFGLISNDIKGVKMGEIQFRNLLDSPLIWLKNYGNTGGIENENFVSNDTLDTKIRIILFFWGRVSHRSICVLAYLILMLRGIIRRIRFKNRVEF